MTKLETINAEDLQNRTLHRRATHPLCRHRLTASAAKKLRQKKTALGHAEDDHEDWDMKQEL